MPTHLHLIVFDDEFNSDRLQETITSFRKFTGRQLSDYCDRDLSPEIADTLRDTHRTDRNRQFWQQSRHPVAIYSEKFWRTKIDYIRANPIRAGLVEDVIEWRFSSASYWLSETPASSDVILSAVSW